MLIEKACFGMEQFFGKINLRALTEENYSDYLQQFTVTLFINLKNFKCEMLIVIFAA